MSNQILTSHKVRPLSAEVNLLTNWRRYIEYTKNFKKELLNIVQEVKDKWPVPIDQTLKNGKDYPEIWYLARKRDSFSDSVLIFSAMSVEAFLNYYGVLRVGQKNYKEHFERLNLHKKLKLLLLICDNVEISNDHEIVQLLNKIASRRNGLVHPKTKETTENPSDEERDTTYIPEDAEKAEEDMISFFKQFELIVPDIKGHYPDELNS